MWLGATSRVFSNQKVVRRFKSSPLKGTAVRTRSKAERRAGGLDSMRVVRTLDEALAEGVDVVMTTGRPSAGALAPDQAALRLLRAPGECALVFGDEVRGLTNRDLRRAGAVATIPTAHKSSLNLAQAGMVFGYEGLKGRGIAAPGRPPPPGTPAHRHFPSRLRGRAP